MESTVLALIGVLGILGILIMFLSSSLIINTLNALLTQHRRQIGVMKLVGARGFNISVMYIALIIAYGIIALIIAVPLGVIGGNGLAAFTGNMLSIDIQGFRVVPIAVVIQIILAFSVSLAAGYFPVNKGAKTTVRRAISEDNPVEESTRYGLVDRLGIWFKWLSRPILISIRNTFRRKARLALTLFTLIMAGAIFIGVFNVRASLSGFMDTMSQHFLADVMISFTEPYRTAQVERELQAIPGVQRVESWGAATAEVLDANDDVESNLIVIGPPQDTELLDADMVAGRWLQPEDNKVLVVSDAIWEEHPEFEVGDTLRVKFPGQRIEEWPVVGIYRFISMSGDMLAYANYDTVAYLTNTPGQATNYRIVAEVDSLEGQSALSEQVDGYLRERGYKISNVEAGKVTREQNSQAVNILVIFLMTMAILTAVVGSIGLMGTMGMNVLERTREIGVMRAIGAVDAQIIKSVVIEGMMIGLISWFLALLLSFPISFVLLRTISTAMMGTIMPLEITAIGFAIWLGVVIFLSVVASMWPARGAARLTIREVLAYE
jgi:putative ABC transport system permease protein